ncbi:MAG: hypothetical protein HC856_04315 [Pseudanabaena sp. RU_4_16]|nr:hypothetical protein [Pseudanabaena sp. RU_4_16]
MKRALNILVVDRLWASILGVKDLTANILMESLLDFKLILIGLTVVFTVSCLFFGTRNGFYDTDKYHGNGSAH